MSQNQQTEQTKWHRFLAKGFELSLGERGVIVLTEVEVSGNPPKVDVLLLRRETDEWTAEQLELLPDGIRDVQASHILIEFKYTESLTLDAVLQAIGYEYFYRKSNGLSHEDVQIFILCPKRPRANRLQEFSYSESSQPGVFHSTFIVNRHVPLLLLNELSSESHNAFVKMFASRSVQKEKAIRLLRNFRKLSGELIDYFEALRVIWSLPEGENMNEVLTPERVIEMGKELARLWVKHVPEDDRRKYIAAELQKDFIEQGVEQGIEQGISQKNREIILAMHGKNFEATVIADIVGLTVEQVVKILNDSASHT